LTDSCGIPPSFARHGEGDTVLVDVPRFLTYLVRSVNHLPLGQWEELRVVMVRNTGKQLH
jgi:hypothetical protein